MGGVFLRVQRGGGRGGEYEKRWRRREVGEDERRVHIWEKGKRGREKRKKRREKEEEEGKEKGEKNVRNS